MPKKAPTAPKSGALHPRTLVKRERAREAREARAAAHKEAAGDRASERRRERAKTAARHVTARVERIEQNPSRAGVDALLAMTRDPSLAARERVLAAKTLLEFAHDGSPRAKKPRKSTPKSRKSSKCPKTPAPKK